MQTIQLVTLEYFEEKYQNHENRLTQIESKSKEETTYLTRHDVAKLLKINLSTVHAWSNKKILKPYYIGNKVYYRSDDIHGLFAEKSEERVQKAANKSQDI